MMMQLSHASVVLLGTRVIYPEGKKFVNLNFSSSDHVPSIIDLWVSKSAVSSSKNSDAPFVVTPSIFRIDPNTGQSVKLIYTEDKLPSDRESVFYLNFLQLPATDKDINKLIITYKSTVKIFYRPSDLKQNIDDVSSFLAMDLSKLSSGGITISNNSEFHVTLSNITLEQNGKKILSLPSDDLGMIAPFSHLQVKVHPIHNINGITSYLSLINDLGGISTYKIKTI